MDACSGNSDRDYHVGSRESVVGVSGRQEYESKDVLDVSVKGSTNMRGQSVVLFCDRWYASQARLSSGRSLLWASSVCSETRERPPIVTDQSVVSWGEMDMLQGRGMHPRMYKKPGP